MLMLPFVFDKLGKVILVYSALVQLSLLWFCQNRSRVVGDNGSLAIFGRKTKYVLGCRAKNREKLLSMKRYLYIWNLLASFNLEMAGMFIHNSTRYSGFLKRPEILETVYSVEEKDGEEGEKVKEKENEEVEKEETLNENGIAAEEEEEKNSDEKVPRRESETTE